MRASELMRDAGPFHRRQVERCSELGIDAGAFPVSQLAVRTRTWHEYLVLRDEFEERSVANLENVWNGRPISKLLLADPVPLSASASVELIELIPPFHQRVYRMGLEHVGFVVGADLDDFSRRHRAVLTGQQFQSSASEPVYILFGMPASAKVAPSSAFSTSTGIPWTSSPVHTKSPDHRLTNPDTG